MKHKTYKFNPNEYFKTPIDTTDSKQLELYLKNIFIAASGITYVTIEVEKDTKYTEPSCKVLEELSKTYPTISYKLVNKKK